MPKKKVVYLLPRERRERFDTLDETPERVEVFPGSERGMSARQKAALDSFFAKEIPEPGDINPWADLFGTVVTRTPEWLVRLLLIAVVSIVIGSIALMTAEVARDAWPSLINLFLP